MKIGNYKKLNESFDKFKIEKYILNAAKKNGWKEPIDFANAISEVFIDSRYSSEAQKKNRINELIEYWGNDDKCSYNDIMNIIYKISDSTSENDIKNIVSDISYFLKMCDELYDKALELNDVPFDYDDYENAKEQVDAAYEKENNGYYYEIDVDNILDYCGIILYDLEMHEFDNDEMENLKNECINFAYKNLPNIKKYI